MENRLIKFTMLLIMATLSIGAFGQWSNDTEQSLMINSVSNYRVVAQTGHSYTWTVVNAEDESSVDPAYFSLTSKEEGGYSIANITWNQNGKYKVSVTDEVVSTTCNTIRISTFTVTVVSNNIIIDWENTDVTTAWGVVNANCPQSSFTIKVALKETSGNTINESKLTFSLIDNNGIDHGLDKSGVQKEITETGGIFEIKITDFVVNDGGGNFTPDFKILKIEDKYGVKPTNLSDISINTKTLTIHRNPNTSEVFHD